MVASADISSKSLPVSLESFAMVENWQHSKNARLWTTKFIFKIFLCFSFFVGMTTHYFST